MKNRYYITMLFLLVFAMSCQDYLREEPPTFISSSNFYKNETDARTACDAIYNALAQQIYARWWPIIDLGTDDVTCATNQAGWSPWLDHTLTGTENWFEAWGQYSGFWVGIGRANSVIANVQKIEMDETKKNAIIGEARAMRALNYFHLVRTYGDLPLIDREVIEKSDFMKPRSSVNEVYETLIIPDLEYAAANCADALHDGRVTKWTAKVILADVFMTYAGWRRTSQGEFLKGDPKYWTMARDVAKDIIDNSPHSLITTPLVNGKRIFPASAVAWSVYSSFTKESMMELGYTGVAGIGSWLSRECGTGAGTGFWGANVNARPLVNEGINLTINQMKFPKITGVGSFIPTPDLWRAFEPGDERRNGGILTRYTTPDGTTYLTQPTFMKYVDFEFMLGVIGTSFQYTNNNFLLYRFADALLIYAEAANEVAPVTANDAAYQAINLLRNRAGLANLATGLSQDDFRKAVWHERRCELAGECKRRFDLIRTKRLATETAQIALQWLPADNPPYAISFRQSNVLHGTVPFPDREWLMPIPGTEMKLNEDNNWVQNEGYK